MSDSFTPRGYQSVTPYFTVENVPRLIDFLKYVFDAEELNVSKSQDHLSHVEIRIGNTIIELSEANDRFSARTNTLHVFVPDTDACYRRAIEIGAKEVYEPADMHYGERSAGIEDPFGNHWYIATFTKGVGESYN
ncbi:VOC family protein [Camelliibacillus cellulosilyticus]|uniref:VOC family protein n=1 Tax=Camelliibacillus cellulosilyticus TaxID=2174486 RepID=A0ABV9GQF2_9BACL